MKWAVLITWFFDEKHNIFINNSQRWNTPMTYLKNKKIEAASSISAMGMCHSFIIFLIDYLDWLLKKCVKNLRYFFMMTIIIIDDYQNCIKLDVRINIVTYSIQQKSYKSYVFIFRSINYLYN